MKLLSISGGGANIGGLYAMAKTVISKGYIPDIYTGTSSGAILSLLMAMNKFEDLEQQVRVFTHKDFFSVSPLNKKGKINIFLTVWRILIGKISIGEQDSLKSRLHEIISDDDWVKFRQSGTRVLITAIDYNQAVRYSKEVNKCLNKTQAIDMIAGSSAMPIFTAGQQYGRFHLFDGGVVDHSPANIAFDMYDDIQEAVILYSRPANGKVFKTMQKKTMLNILTRTMDIMSNEISLTDQQIEKDKMKQKGTINRGQYFLDSPLLDMYDVDPLRLERSYLAGVEEINSRWGTFNEKN